MEKCNDDAVASQTAPAMQCSHVVPPDSLPLSDMKEELSMAYIHMLASSTGLTVGTWTKDFDCRDVTLSSSVDYSPNQYGPKIDIQLKASGREDISRPKSIAWSLDTRSYRKLSKRNRSTPSLFCVLRLPDDAGFWLRCDREGMLARSTMYWLWGHEFAPQKPNQKNQTVSIPKHNTLTPSSILELMEVASRWQPEMS